MYFSREKRFPSNFSQCIVLYQFARFRIKFKDINYTTRSIYIVVPNQYRVALRQEHPGSFFNSSVH